MFCNSCIQRGLLSSGISVRNVLNDCSDVDQIITNVTIKDAPFELSDSYILHRIQIYGDIIENSVRRGKIKGTEIETGTRYLQMVNVKDVLPTVVTLGRFKVRVFSDNKTECKICKEVGHPFYRCPMKNNPPPKLCGRCKSSTHKTRDCTNDVVCNHCNESGHKQKDCADYKLMVAQQSYGIYAHDILEGRQAAKEEEELGTMTESSTPRNIETSAATFLDDGLRMNLNFQSENEGTDETAVAVIENTVELIDTQTETTVDTSETKTTVDTNELNNETDKNPPTRQVAINITQFTCDHMDFLIGDSNGVRVHIKDADVRNISKSGHKAADIQSMLKEAGSLASTENEKVKRIVLHLGTNDVSKHKTDAAQVQLEVATAISETHKKFPDAEIAYPSILQRRGKSTAIAAMNKTAKTVNEYIKKLAIKERYLSFQSSRPWYPYSWLI